MRTDRVTAGRNSYVTGLMNAYARGKEARRQGLGLLSCPYKRGDHSKSWRDGWVAERKEVPNDEG